MNAFDRQLMDELKAQWRQQNGSGCALASEQQEYPIAAGLAEQSVGAVNMAAAFAQQQQVSANARGQDADLLDFHSQRLMEGLCRPPPVGKAVGAVEGPKPSNLQTWVIFPDCHIPFENGPYLDLVISICHSIKPHGIASIGDFGDMLSVSAHPKSPTESRWQLKDEVEAVNARLDQIDAVGAKERLMCLGNHDIRGQRMAMKQMAGLYDTLDPVHMYRLKERGWTAYKYQEHVRVGKLWLVHDSGYSGRYAVFQNGDAFGASTVQGHTHHAGVQYFGTVLGERHVSATIGWLGDDRFAQYLAPVKKARNWQNAFGVAYVEVDSGNTHLQVVPIVNGRAVVNGQMFEAKK